MFGTYQHSIDSKGRVFVPAKLRPELGNKFYVAPGLNHYLTVYTEKSWQQLMERYNELPMTKMGALRILLSNAAECETDKQNRILLPQNLRSYANLEQDVVFLGLGDHAEIWNAETYAAVEADTLTPEYLTKSLEELGF